MKKDENVLWILLPSFLGLFVSTISLVGLTLAWFRTNMTSDSNTTIAANFLIDAAVSKDDSLESSDGNIYHLKEGTYTVDLTRAGTSTSSSGYALIKLGDYTYHTQALQKGEPINFRITTDTPMDLEFFPVWGTDQLNDESSIKTDSHIDIKLQPETPPEFIDTPSITDDDEENEQLQVDETTKTDETPHMNPTE